MYKVHWNNGRSDAKLHLDDCIELGKVLGKETSGARGQQGYEFFSNINDACSFINGLNHKNKKCCNTCKPQKTSKCCVNN